MVLLGIMRYFTGLLETDTFGAAVGSFIESVHRSICLTGQLQVQVMVV